ncbi:phospholipase D family protein, partial [Xanthomonas oryzae pv. oryzae]
MKCLLRVLVLATVLLGTGCASLSQTERNRAAGVAAAARSTVVNCTQANRCAQPSPLRALGGEAITAS